MPLNAAIQRIQRLMGFNGVLTDGAGGSAQTDLSNLVGPTVAWAELGARSRALGYLWPTRSAGAQVVGCRHRELGGDNKSENLKVPSRLFAGARDEFAPLTRSTRAPLTVSWRTMQPTGKTTPSRWPSLASPRPRRAWAASSPCWAWASLCVDTYATPGATAFCDQPSAPGWHCTYDGHGRARLGMGRLGMGELSCVDTYAPGTVRRTGCAYQPSACCTKAQGSLPRGGTTVRTMYAYQPRACRTYLAYRTYRVVHPRRVRLTLTLTRRVRLFRRAPHVVLDRRHDLPLLHGHHGRDQGVEP